MSQRRRHHGQAIAAAVCGAEARPAELDWESRKARALAARKDRRCAHDGCTTILSTDNPGPYCRAHKACHVGDATTEAARRSKP